MTDTLAIIGPLGIPLLLLSLVGATVIIERLFFYVRLPAIANCKRYQSLQRALEKNCSQPKAIRDELISDLLSRIKEPYLFGIRILRLISVVAPMLGLLGTVLGIIDSFKVISTHEGAVHPSLIADGLWVAMLTTAVGLIIALPCLFFAFIFARKAEKRMAIYEQHLNKASLEIEGVVYD